MEIPPKGRDIIGYDKDDVKYYVFRCNCHNPKCTKWRCSITGGEISVNIVRWEEDNLK